MRRAAMHWNRGLSCLTIGAAACPSAGPLRLLVLVATCIAGTVLALPSAYHQAARADQTGRAQPTDWVEGTPGRGDGATRDFYTRAGLHPLGWYCHDADMNGRYGDIRLWQEDYRGYLENNRWYSIEQYVKLNTPGEQDGILRAWGDGWPADENIAPAVPWLYGYKLDFR